MNSTTRFIQELENGGEQTLVVFGTSLSFHLAPLLRDALTARYGERVTVVNSGLSGKASRSGSAELEAKVLKYQPDTVLFEFAINDAYLFEEYPDETLDKGITLEQSRVNAEAIVSRIQKALPRCEIMLQTMNPTYDSKVNDQRAGSRRPQLESFYEGYREVAKAHNLELIDNYAMWNAMRNKESERFQELIPDGTHPTPRALRSVLVPHLLKELGVTASNPQVF